MPPKSSAPDGRPLRWQYLERFKRAGDVLSGFLHDLNNPLAGVLGYLQLARTQNDPVRRAEYLDIAAGQADRCRALIERFEEALFVRPPRMANVSVDEVVAATLRRRAPELAAKGVAIRQELATGLPPATGDLDLLCRALGRLLQNAETAVESPGASPERAITVRTALAGTRLYIEVHDSGPGIAPDLRDQVFDPAFTTRRSGRGAGLGLIGALAIMDSHGGDVIVVPEGPPGAVVRLELPAAQVQPIDAGRHSNGAASTVPPAARVLCVDDERFILDLYKDVFSFVNVHVETATDVAEALKVVEAMPLDLLICDYNLPGGNARALYSAVRELQPKLADRFVVCTGEPAVPGLDGWEGGGTVRVLRKPFSIKDIRALLPLE